MAATIAALRWILRIAFLVDLIIGFALWGGRGYQFLSLHMWTGFLITFDLLVLVILSLLARVRPLLPLLSLLWAVLLPVIGIAQLRMLPGPNHWVIRVIHLLLGIGAIGLGEVLSKRALLFSRK